MKYSLLIGLLLSGWLLAALPLAAADVVFYRCTDAQGALTVQNMPCPKGMQQTTKVMQAIQSPPPVPAPVPVSVPTVTALMPAPVEAHAPAAKAPTPAPVQAPPQPLPPLLQCQTTAGETYFSEEAQAPSRCVAMRVTGLDGNPMTGAGEACEVVSDRCTEIAANQACAAWKQRTQEAESHWRFARAENAARNQQEFERLQRLIDASHCEH